MNPQDNLESPLDEQGGCHSDTPPNEALTPEVICGDEMFRCRCGLPPGHDGTIHECAEGDPQCGGAWRDHETDPTLAYIVRWPGIRGGPNDGRNLVDPGPESTVVEPRQDDGGFRFARGPIKFLPPPSLAALGALSVPGLPGAVEHARRMEEDLLAKMRTPEPEFVNDAVRLTVPAGTDPLAAVKEAMGEFMERSDGTNAAPWWTLARWWHGSHAGFKRGTILLPPSETGVIPGLDGSDRSSVYITTNRADALLCAARHDRPMLYEVTGLGREPQRDDVVPEDLRSWRVPACTVYRVEQPSALELRRVLYELESP